MIKFPIELQSGSSIVSVNSMIELSKQHEIDLICFKFNNEEFLKPDYINNLTVVKSDIKKPFFLSKFLLTLVGTPPSISVFSSKLMRRKIQELTSLNSYDRILLFELSAMQYINRDNYRKVIINIEDPQSLKLWRLSKLKIWSSFQAIRIKLLSLSTYLYEIKILHQASKVLLLSHADVLDFRKIHKLTNLVHVPYGITPKKTEKLRSYSEREQAIVYTGNMFHPANIDGALFLINEIMPILLAKEPGVVLWIVGAEPDQKIKEAAKLFPKNIVVTGRVASVSDYLERAKVSVCPILLSIGVQTKVLEAMSLGTPVVSTSAGNSGINGIDGQELHVCDDPNIFALKICRLINGIDWQDFSIRGRDKVLREFSWEKSARILNKYLQ